MAERKINIWFAMVLGWLVPGLGHFYARRRLHGVFYLTMIAGVFIAGMLISGGTAVNYDIHRWYFLCQLMAGPATLAVEYFRGDEAIYLGETISVLMHQSGTVYVAVAGVLNLIAICELFRRHARPEDPGPADTMRSDAIKEEKARREGKA